MPYQRMAQAVLAEWREVERQLADEPDPYEVERLQSAALGLRDEYQALIAAARAESRPEPPPFPETVDS